MTIPPIHIRAHDYDRLLHLAESAPLEDTAFFLRRELDRAVIVAEPEQESVQMGSRVRFRDDGGRIHQLRLAYPEESAPAEGSVSIMTPVGSALIGLGAGATMQWQDRNGRTRELTVLEVGA
jgi:regulator of nucleoside diphosphate kinase